MPIKLIVSLQEFLSHQATLSNMKTYVVGTNQWCLNEALLMNTTTRIFMEKSGLSCSKLTMSLVNVSLKIWSFNMAYMLIFLLKKCE